MADLNLDLNYLDHPKTMRLVSMLGADAELLPIRLWIFVAKYHAENGALSGYSEAEIEARIKWRGKAGQALEALVACRFLDRTEDGFAVHDWLNHQGHIDAFKKRSQKAAATRWKKARGDLVLEECLTNAPSIRERCLSDAPAVLSSAVLSKANRQQPLNLGFYPIELAAAKRIVAAYSRVGSAYPPSGNVEAEIVGAMLDHPTRTESDFIAAIDAYAAAVATLDPKSRKGALKFFQTGEWQRYIDANPPDPQASLEEQIAAAKLKNERAAKAARGEK